jgi:hypothetical protein
MISEIGIIPAQPGYYMVRPVWSGDTPSEKLQDLSYTPVIGWAVEALIGKKKMDGVQVTCSTPVAAWDPVHEDGDALMLRPDGSVVVGSDMVIEGVGDLKAAFERMAEDGDPSGKSVAHYILG